MKRLLLSIGALAAVSLSSPSDERKPHIMRKTVNESTVSQEVAGRAQMKKLIRFQSQPC